MGRVARQIVGLRDTAVFLDRVARLAAAVDALADADPADRAQRLGLLEATMSACLDRYRAILDLACQPGALRRRERFWAVPNADQEQFMRFIRAVIAVRDVVGAVTATIGGPENRSWGAHLFRRQDFDLAEFEPLEVEQLTPEALQLLLPDLVAELIDAVRLIIRERPGVAPPLRRRIEEPLRSACVRLTGRGAGAEVDVSVLGRAAFLAHAGLTETELSDAIDDRRVLTVRDWEGEQVFPVFQAPTRGIHPLVDSVAPRVPASFDGWPLTLWLKEAVGTARKARTAADQLADLGAWVPAAKRGGRDRWKVLPPADRAAVPLLPDPSDPPSFSRVTRRGNEPFYFAAFEAGDWAEAGRFDLPKVTDHGAIYLADGPEGAWAETLTRIPVLRLADLLGRELWTLRPLDTTLSIIDLTAAGADFAGERRRRVTQGVALRAFQRPDAGGLRVLLRTGTTSVVLFGREGPTAPGAAGIGVWEASRRRAELDQHLWAYLQDRQQLRPHALQYLRRFPGDVLPRRRRRHA